MNLVVICNLERFSVTNSVDSHCKRRSWTPSFEDVMSVVLRSTIRIDHHFLDFHSLWWVNHEGRCESRIVRILMEDSRFLRFFPHFIRMLFQWTCQKGTE